MAHAPSDASVLGSRPKTYEDAADGVMCAPPANEETTRLLKKLGYPEIQEATKPSALLIKALEACQKRLKKLQELLPADANLKASDPGEDPASPETLQSRPLVQNYTVRIEAYT